MSKKTLPMGIPVLQCFNRYASITSLITSEADMCYLYNSYIQITCVDGGVFAFDNYRSFFELCPYVDACTLSRKMLSAKGSSSLRDLILQAIDNDYYVFLFIDNFYLSESEAYQKFHLNHELFICGYDTRKGTFNIADNLDSGRYIKTQTDIANVEQGYWNMEIKPGKEFLTKIILLEKKEITHAVIDIPRIRLGFEFYLKSKGSLEYSNSRMQLFGLDVVRYMIKQFQGTTHKGEIDLRQPYFLWEHKKLMTQRITYLIEHGYMQNENDILNSFVRLDEEYHILLCSAIKYSISKKEGILSKIIDRAEELIRDEEQVMAEVLEGLK